MRDGNSERPAEHPEYKDSWFFNASTKNKPEVVDKNLEYYYRAWRNLFRH